MLSAYRLPIFFDPAPLEAEIRKSCAEGRWIDHWAEGLASPGTWTVLALIAGPGDLCETTATRLSIDDAPRPTAILAEMPRIRAVIESFRTAVLRARLMRLKAHAAIGEHRDFAYFGGQRWSFERGRVRVHIPIITDGSVTWRINGQTIAMTAGEAWYVNVCRPHSVENRGGTDRINLVLELEVNDWLREIFPAQSWRERLWGATLRRVEPRLWRLANAFRHRGLPSADSSARG